MLLEKLNVNISTWVENIVKNTSNFDGWTTGECAVFKFHATKGKVKSE